MLPKRLQELLKKHDKSVKVGMTDVMLPDVFGNPSTAAPGFFLTPQARESILRGQHVFADGGSVPYPKFTSRSIAEKWTPPEDIDPRLSKFIEEYPAKMAEGIANIPQAIWDTVKYPGQLLYGEKQFDTDEAIKRAVDTTGAAMTGSFPFARAAAGEAVLGSGPIQKLMQDVSDQRGLRMGQRVERAADEIPNLENLYTQQALRDAFMANDQLLMSMKPSDFAKLATPLPGPPDASKIAMLTDVARSGGFNQVPWLQLRELEGMPVISSHEGRHRSLALDAKGEPSSLVQISPHPHMKQVIKDALEEKFGYINPYDKMRFMDQFNKQFPDDLRVVPQGKSLDELQKVKLPEPYKKGGSVVDRALVLTSKKALSRRGRPE
jgi:hypothetical protein